MDGIEVVALESADIIEKVRKPINGESLIRASVE
jgi:hypothetical protein